MPNIANLSQVVKALGGEVKPGKCPCPICRGKLSVDEKHGKVLLKCWGRGCDNDTQIIPWLRERGAWGGQRSKPQRTNGQDEEKLARRVRRAKAILKAARKANLSPEAYLNGRGIQNVPDNAFLLPASGARRLNLAHANFSRVVVPVVNNAGEETGCHTIVLTKDGTKKLRLKDKSKTVKLSYGLLQGSHVRIGESDPDSPLVITEGFETACTAADITRLPTIATLGTAFLERVDLPDCSEAIICADSGAPGIAAAKALAHRLTVPTRIAIPNGPDGYDFNDAVRDGASVKALKRMILSADLFKWDGRTEERTLTTRAVAIFEALPLEWFWEPFIPLAMATAMFGDGGIGKSTIVLDLIARVTSGKRMPLCKGEALSGSALILTKEDDMNRVVRPRLEAAGADLSKVHVVGYDVPDDPKEFDTHVDLSKTIAELERLIVEHGDVRITVLDPASDFCGKVDPNDEKAVRDFLTPLTSLARRHNIGIIIIIHINKDAMQAAQHRGLGSVAWRNVPRSAVLVADDPDTGSRKLMVQTKTNLTEFGLCALGFTMRTVKVGESGYGVVEWEDELCDADPEKLMAKRQPKTKLEQANEFLQDLLKDGSMPREEIECTAEGEGIAWTTIKRAKKELRVVSFKRKGETGYRWRLPTRRGT